MNGDGQLYSDVVSGDDKDRSMSPAASPTVSPILWFNIYWLKDYRRKKSTLHFRRL